MSLPIRLLPEATDELTEAVDWYKLQRPGLGKQFLSTIRRVIRSVAANPKMHAVVYKDVRKAVVPVYPYIVLYREEQGELVVVSVFHTSRDPAEWQSRV
jgi:plasmid stabilization system protein ParE